MLVDLRPKGLKGNPVSEKALVRAWRSPATRTAFPTIQKNHFVYLGRFALGTSGDHARFGVAEFKQVGG